MDKADFWDELDRRGIDRGLVKFDDSASDDVYCVNKNYFRYEVFYRERGRQFDFREFTSESEALLYLLSMLGRGSVHGSGDGSMNQPK